MELTNRQWRALAHAFPYYVPLSPGSEETPAEGARVENCTKRAEFAQYIVPRASKAFQNDVEAWVDSHAECHQTQSPVNAVEAIMSYFFGRAAAFATSAPLAAPACAAAPLTARELQLLGLYHRKQEQYEYVQSTQQRLLEASQTAMQVLQTALHAVVAGCVEESKDGGLLDSARESWLLLGRASQTTAAELRLSSFEDFSTGAPAATAAGASFTSALASLPYAAPTAMNTGSRLSASELPPSLVVVNRCAGCGEVGGDLLVCTQCGEVRHEACGGPHPPERSRVDGSLPCVNVCRKCAKDLNLSSSSSSLRSSTSSSERAELGEYFDSEEGTESSLSGFVVRSSDEEEGDTEGSSSRGSPIDDCEDEDEEAQRGKTAPNGKHRQADNVQLSSARKREKFSKKQNRSRRRSDSSEEEGEEPLRQQEKRRRREDVHRQRTASTSEDEASFSLSASSSAGKQQESKFNTPHDRAHAPLTAKKTGAVHSKERRSAGTTTPLSTQERRRMQDEQDELTMLGIATDAAIPARKANTTLAKKAETPTSSADASHAPSQPHPRGAVSRRSLMNGRRSVVDIASSSSSSSDSG